MVMLNLESTEGKYDAVLLEDSEWFRTTRPRITPGRALRLYRLQRGLGQGELARMLGPSFRKQQVSAMENDRRGISKAVTKKRAVALRAPIERFL